MKSQPYNPEFRNDPNRLTLENAFAACKASILFRVKHIVCANVVSDLHLYRAYTSKG